MWSRTRWTRVRRAAGRTPRHGTRRCARGNRMKAVWRRGCAARCRSARPGTAPWARAARCPPRPRCLCDPRIRRSLHNLPPRAGRLDHRVQVAVDAGERKRRGGRDIVEPALERVEQCEESRRIHREWCAHGVLLFCLCPVACPRAPSPQAAAVAHGCHIPMRRAPIPRPERRMWISGRHSGHPQPPCRLWIKARVQAFFSRSE